MNTCDTCKWWQWIGAWDDKKHLCCHPLIGRALETSNRDGAEIENHSDATGIITGPKFGCVHWEPK